MNLDECAAADTATRQWSVFAILDRDKLRRRHSFCQESLLPGSRMETRLA